MANTLKYGLFCLLLVTGINTAVQAQDKTRILIVLDASWSMNNQWQGGIKWDIAKTTLKRIADSVSLYPDVEMGLRIFGHQYPEPDKNCRDSRLEVRIDSNNIKAIYRKLDEVKPRGITPLVYSLEKCLQDFGSQSTRNVLIVITDGEDVCGGNICEVAAALRENKISMQPFIIGMQLQPAAVEKMQCAGLLLNTSNAEEFSKTLEKTVQEAIERSTVQIDLQDHSGKPTETNVAISFYNRETGAAVYHMVHTLNAWGLPDTFSLSPNITYDMHVHTLPAIVKENIQVQKNKHNIIRVQAAQSMLEFTSKDTTLTKSSYTDRIQCLVYEPGTGALVNIQSLNSTTRYLTGKYNLEVTTLPRIELNDVSVDAMKTTTVHIPAPGKLTLQKNVAVTGGILWLQGNSRELIYELGSDVKPETVLLQPGKYSLVYRQIKSTSIQTSVDKEFEITSGGNVSLRLD